MNKGEIETILRQNSPWYQRISLPYELTTTDQPLSWYQDDAWDNVIDDVKLEDASRLRPIPKWNHLKKIIPPLEGKTVLEIGSNCGFFTFEFAKTAKRAVGIDVSPDWHRKSLILKDLKAVENVEFYLCDFFLLEHLDQLPLTSQASFFSPNGLTMKLLPNIADVIFCSTVIDHIYFPFLFIYKILLGASSCAIIDTPIIDSWSPSDSFGHNQFLHIDGPKNGSHHGFSATSSFWKFLLKRLNVDESIVAFHRYSQNNLCIVVDTSKWIPMHLGC
jgi:SAM-dependent methyltransferase